MFCMRNKFILVTSDGAFKYRFSPSVVKAGATHTVVQIVHYTVLAGTVNNIQVLLGLNDFPTDGSELI